VNDPVPSDAGRAEELFVADLLFGLTPDEEAEYDRLRSTAAADFDSLAGAIGALDATWAGVSLMRLPTHLREKIRADALTELSPPRPRPARSRLTRVLPWAISAACAAALLVTLVLNRPAREPDAAQQRAQLLASAPDVVRAEWEQGPTPVPGAGGDVAWSPAEQRGYMLFRGLPANEPTVEQYQLWIFDRNQSEKTPIDGGVFDVPAGGEVVVPVRAKLAVKDVYLFAVTVEKPGGVVVSSRERLPLVAKVQPQ
jgi:hypothetical protein